MNEKTRFILDTVYKMYPDATCELDFSNNEDMEIPDI